MSMSVCVCLCVCPRGYLRNHMLDLYHILCMLPMAVARYFSGVVEIRDVLPVLWMSSCFSIIGRIAVWISLRKTDLWFRLNLLNSPHGIAMPKGLYFTSVVSSFFFLLFLLFSKPNLRGHWTDLNQTWIHYWLMTAVWKIWPELPGRLPLYGLGTQKSLVGTDFQLWPNVSLQNMISIIDKKLANLHGLPYRPPTFGELSSTNGWERLASLCPSP